MEVVQQFNKKLILEESLVRPQAGGLSKASSSSSSSSDSSGDENIKETNGDNVDLMPFVPTKEEGETENNDGAKKSVYFDQNEGDAFGQPQAVNYIKAADLSTALQNVAIQNVISAVVNGETGENLQGKLLSIPQSGNSQEGGSSTHSRGFSKGKHIKFDIEQEEEEETEEEIVEMEFERAVHKVHHTHNMYCPNCRNQITKVILRRRIKVKQEVPIQTSTQGGLFGCLSCFGIFSSEGDELRPFQLWTPRQPSTGTVQNNQGEGFNCFGLFGMSGGTEDHVNKPTQPGQRNEVAEGPTLPKPGNNLGTPPPPENIIRGDHILNIPPKPGTDVPEPSRLLPDVTNAEKPDIIKSIVYGGLTESLTSLSVITSAAASNATTLNIVALGFANLIAGLFVLGQSLLEMKNDQQVGRYQEVLGRKKHFLLHATLAILSYLVFGLVPPVVYGFTFRETDDRDFKLLAVAASSFVSIVILAIGKAYIQGRPHKFTTYLKTVLYYLTTATAASGVAFAVGDLVNKFMEKLGWFEPNQAGTLLFAGIQSQHPSFASY